MQGWVDPQPSHMKNDVCFWPKAVMCFFLLTLDL